MAGMASSLPGTRAGGSNLKEKIACDYGWFDGELNIGIITIAFDDDIPFNNLLGPLSLSAS